MRDRLLVYKSPYIIFKIYIFTETNQTIDRNWWKKIAITTATTVTGYLPVHSKELKISSTSMSLQANGEIIAPLFTVTPLTQPGGIKTTIPWIQEKKHQRSIQLTKQSEMSFHLLIFRGILIFCAQNSWVLLHKYIALFFSKV